MAFFDAAQRDRERREDERDRRAREVVESFGPLAGKATVGGVTVQVDAGGAPQNVDIPHAALRRGAAALRSDLLSASRRATARANHRAQQAYGRALGAAGVEATRELGLTYDPELLDDEEPEGGLR